MSKAGRTSIILVGLNVPEDRIVSFLKKMKTRQMNCEIDETQTIVDRGNLFFGYHPLVRPIKTMYTYADAKREIEQLNRRNLNTLRWDESTLS